MSGFERMEPNHKLDTDTQGMCTWWGLFSVVVTGSVSMGYVGYVFVRYVISHGDLLAPMVAGFVFLVTLVSGLIALGLQPRALAPQEASQPRAQGAVATGGCTLLHANSVTRVELPRVYAQLDDRKVRAWLALEHAGDQLARGEVLLLKDGSYEMNRHELSSGHEIAQFSTYEEAHANLCFKPWLLD